ncbi:UNVERIFIED_CONTAM: hypothetical protein FKN15_021969 [Acipenser sinensis]
MSSGSKLENLNLTSDEIDRFSKAFKDEKFRELLHEYAEEISNPENKKKYEEEITMMEQERGMDVKFIHPQPGHALKTSVNGAQKCFVNICSNDLLSKPVCKPGKAGDGKAGQLWSLPYSLAPGREDMGAKAERHMVYDVVFHPDTLYMAGRNDRFKKMVDETAIEAIQKQFNVKLDKKNTKTLKTKYKGAPHPTVIRKPLPGAKEAEPPTEPNDEGALEFPYPYDRNTHRAAGNGVEESRKEAGNVKGEIKSDSDKQNKPTTPTHAIKYRSFVDFQDYRCSRDSAPSARPRELVITIDLPLLKCAGDADLDVTENRFLLQSQKPAYRLDFPLPYPVNENQGTATFIKARKQLVVTLPVLPAAPEASSQAVCEVQSEPDGTVEEDLSDSNVTAGCRSCDTIPACDSQVHDNLRTTANKNTSELPAFPTGGVEGRSEDSLEVSCSDGEKTLPYESDKAQPITPVKKSEVAAGTAHYCDALPNHLQTRVKAEASEKSLEDCPSESEPRCPAFHLSQDNTSVTLFIDIKGIVRESFNSVLTATAYKVTFGTSELEKASYSLVLQFPPACHLQSSHSAAAVCEHSAPVSVVLSKSSQSSHSAAAVCEHSAPVSVVLSKSSQSSHSAAAVCEHSAPVSVVLSKSSQSSHSAAAVCEHSAPVSVVLSKSSQSSHSAAAVCEHSAPVSVVLSKSSQSSHSAAAVCEHSAPVSVVLSKSSQSSHSAAAVCEHSAPVSVVLSKSSQSSHSAAAVCEHSAPVSVVLSKSSQSSHSAAAVCEHSAPVSVVLSKSSQSSHSAAAVCEHSAPVSVVLSKSSQSSHSAAAVCEHSAPVSVVLSKSSQSSHSAAAVCEHSAPVSVVLSKSSQSSHSAAAVCEHSAPVSVVLSKSSQSSHSAAAVCEHSAPVSVVLSKSSQSSHSAAAVCEHSAPVSVVLSKSSQSSHSAAAVCEHSAPVSVVLSKSSQSSHSAAAVCEHSAPVSVVFK